MKGAKDSNISRLKVLSKANFQNSQGDAQKEEGHEVGDQEGTTSICKHERGESPDISKSDGGTHRRKEELRTGAPVAMGLLFVEDESETAFLVANSAVGGAGRFSCRWR